MKLKAIKAMSRASIARAKALQLKALASTGVPKHIRRMAAHAIRRDRCIRASIILSSPMLIGGCAGVVMMVARIDRAMPPLQNAAWLLKALIILIGLSAGVLYKNATIRRRHTLAKLKREVRRSAGA